MRLMRMALRCATLPPLRRPLDRGELSAVEAAAITRAALDRVAPAFNGLAVVAALVPEHNVAEARAADVRRAGWEPAGRLNGSPYAAKDLFAATGAPPLR
jgi:Asp-tRNA(Asn)/Glu-tRNA(Gln) amidotransferase A subunit family amidase